MCICTSICDLVRQKKAQRDGRNMDSINMYSDRLTICVIEPLTDNTCRSNVQTTADSLKHMQLESIISVEFKIIDVIGPSDQALSISENKKIFRTKGHFRGQQHRSLKGKEITVKILKMIVHFYWANFNFLLD